MGCSLRQGCRTSVCVTLLVSHEEKMVRVASADVGVEALTSADKRACAVCNLRTHQSICHACYNMLSKS